MDSSINRNMHDRLRRPCPTPLPTTRLPTTRLPTMPLPSMPTCSSSAGAKHPASHGSTVRMHNPVAEVVGGRA